MHDPNSISSAESPRGTSPSGLRRRFRLWAVLAVAALTVACGRRADPEVQAPPEKSALEQIARAPMPAVGAGGGAFVDVASAAGLTVTMELPSDDIRSIVESVGSGAAFSDLDGDGWLDLVVVGGPRYPVPEGTPAKGGGIWVYRNLGDGTFEDVTERSGLPRKGYGVSVAVADVDGDGARDVYIVDRGPNRLYRNKGDFRFEDISDRAGVADDQYGVAAIFLDLEGDGDQDLYVGNYLEYEELGTPYFSPDGYPGPLSYAAHTDALYRNKGDGTFENISDAAGVGALPARAMSAAAADLDGDGDTDVFVANDAEANLLLLNDGQGKFVEGAVAAGVALGADGNATAAMATDLGDVDGDGQLDMVVSDDHFGAYYRGVAKGLFRDQVMESGLGALSGQYVTWGQVLLDFDNDGDLDLFAVNGGLKHLVAWEDSLLSNRGDGTFEDAAEQGGSWFEQRRVGRSAIAGDYDNDGDIDIFMTNLGQPAALLRNDGPSKGAWITVDLVGKASRDPFGARVEVTAAGRSWSAEYRCPAAYLGQGDPRVHLGLGAEVQRIERVSVRWPSGAVTERTDLPVNQILKVEEGT
jgi:hypothetical protein